jgi:hypothetical protein
MPRTYNDEAIEKCAKLYLKFHGQQHERIEAEMRKVWPGWSKQNLYTRGKGANLKVGWIEKFGWEEALRLKVATTARQVSTSAETLFLEIEGVRERLKAALDAQGGTDRDLVYQHRDYCKLSIDAMARLDAGGDNLNSFVAMWERVMTWLPEISLSATHALLEVAEAVLERAKVEFAKA